MEYRKLGRTGLKVSALCMGSMQFGWTAGEDESYRILSRSFEAGINFIDTADIYSRWAAGNPGGVAETIIGNWMKRNGIPRHEVIIATKVRGRVGDAPNDEGLSRAHIFHAVEQSLRRLQTDYIDLYQTHWYDDQTSIEETLSALDDLVRMGKVRYIGCSNYPAWRLMQALWTSDKLGLARFDSLQPHYNLVHRAEYERELAQVCQTYGLGVLPYSPLAGGFLSGKYRRGQTQVESQRNVSRYFTESGWKTLDALDEIALQRGVSVSQVALAWLLTQPGITSPIIGPRSIEQLEDNLNAADLRLNDDEMSRLNEASRWQ
ncbi:MAG: aldo/keto reductase [Chloroflexota bacterium]